MNTSYLKKTPIAKFLCKEADQLYQLLWLLSKPDSKVIQALSILVFAMFFNYNTRTFCQKEKTIAI